MKSDLESPEEVKEKKPAVNSSNFTKGFKYNGLPKLDKRGASKQRVVHTPQPGKDNAEENTTTQMSTHSRATHKIPLSDATSRKTQVSQKNPHKSLPRIIGGPRKLEKMPKSKMVGIETDQMTEKDAKLSTTKGDGNASKSAILLRQFNKSVPGYSDGKTKTNQDTVYVNINVKNFPNCALFGVFDGHGLQGHKVSQNLKSNLTEAFEIRFDPEKTYTEEEYTGILEAVCVDINNKLIANQGINSFLSGSTGILVLLHQDFIVCANVGDSRAGIIKVDAIDQPALLTMLSRDHTPIEADEKERIINAGGKVMPCVGKLIVIRPIR